MKWKPTKSPLLCNKPHEPLLKVNSSLKQGGINHWRLSSLYVVVRPLWTRRTMIEGYIPLYTFRNLSMTTVEEMAMVGSKSGRRQG